MHDWWVVPTLSIALGLVACGGKGAAGPGKTADLDGDPLALLPGSAVFAGNLDTRALYQSTLGPRLAAIGDKLLPLGEDAGFRASRDVNRVVFGGYANTGGEVAVIVRGRFDQAKLETATHGKDGAPIVRGTYAGRTTFTIGAASYAVLTGQTVVVGSVDGVRRVLERIQAGTSVANPCRPGSPMRSTRRARRWRSSATSRRSPSRRSPSGSLRLPWLQGLRSASGIGNFGPPGMNFASTLTYGVQQQAEASAEGVRSLDGWLKVLGPLLGGIRLQNLEISTDRNDMRCKFALDDEAIGGWLHSRHACFPPIRLPRRPQPPTPPHDHARSSPCLRPARRKRPRSLRQEHRPSRALVRRPVRGQKPHHRLLARRGQRLDRERPARDGRCHRGARARASSSCTARVSSACARPSGTSTAATPERRCAFFAGSWRRSAFARRSWATRRSRAVR